MDNIIKQLKRGAKHTRLSVEEKATMKSALLQHVAAHPASESLFQGMGIPSPFSVRNFRNKKSLSLFVIGGLLMGGSVSFAAENTVPGDTLYPVKVHFNEPVRGAIARTPKAKAEWEVRLVERRLEEVEKLEAKDDVRQDTREAARTNLEKYTERVNGRIAKFEEDNDSEDAIATAGKLADILRTHERVLIKMNTPATQENNVANLDAPKQILEKLRVNRDDAEKKYKDLKRKYHKGDDATEPAPVSPPTMKTPGTPAFILPTTHPGSNGNPFEKRERRD